MDNLYDYAWYSKPHLVYLSKIYFKKLLLLLGLRKKNRLVGNKLSGLDEQHLSSLLPVLSQAFTPDAKLVIAKLGDKFFKLIKVNN
jgi:hypothetical protein